MAAVEGVRVVRLGDVAPVALPGDSWSRVLISSSTVGTNEACMGYSVFTPGMATDDLSHEVEELAYVVSGSGELRMRDGVVGVSEGSAAYIAPHVWHTVANTGTQNLVMVFAFTSSDYPPTEHAPSRVTNYGA
jgi:quercetin dioxygenase-like cupin family protein